MSRDLQDPIIMLYFSVVELIFTCDWLLIILKLICYLDKSYWLNEMLKNNTLYASVRKSWSSGFGRRFMFKRLCVQIPTPATGWTFFTLICCIYLYCLLEETQINEKEAKDGPGLTTYLLLTLQLLVY